MKPNRRIPPKIEMARVDGGLVSGVSGASPGVQAFKGIPYASPPVGERRWRPPQPVEPWAGVHPAGRFAPCAIQVPRHPEWNMAFSSYDTGLRYDEDCLYLNVWTAAASPEERRPVLLWIHGGGFILGSGSEGRFDGEALSRKGAVVVTINYRLNVFGFLAHPELSRESERAVSGNYGLLDMIAAIGWTRRNIACFGGDPDRITLFGNSAGSVAVSTLASSPLLKGALKGAIAQSIVLTDAPDLAEMEWKGVEFARFAGGASLADLRRMSAAALLEAMGKFGPGKRWRPLRDDWILSGDLFSPPSGGEPPYVLLTGSTADEGAAPVNPIPARDFAARAGEIYGELASQFLALYPAGTDESAADSQFRAFSDKIAWQHQAWAARRARAGHPAFLYRFTREPPLPAGVRYHTGGFFAKGRLLPERMGAFHEAEITYVFDSLGQMKRPWQARDRELADLVSSYWVNFAAVGDPNGPGLPRWPAYGSQADSVMDLGDDVRPIPSPLSPAKVEFWSAEQARNPLAMLLYDWGNFRW